MSPSPGKIAFAWILTIVILVVIAILFFTIDPQIFIYNTILGDWLPDMTATGGIIIAVYRMSLLIVAIGTIIYAVIVSFSEESDTYDTYGGY